MIYTPRIKDSRLPGQSRGRNAFGGIRALDRTKEKMKSQPIKVLHLISTLISGGAQRQLTNVVRGTSVERINHVVCVVGEAGFFAPCVREAGFKVIELNIFGKRPFLQTALKFRKVIAEEKPDVIHSRLYDANISSRLANIISGDIPIITSLESPDYAPETSRAGNWDPRKVRALRLLDKFTAALTQPYFVACSESVKKSYQLHYGIDEDKTQVIYNLVDQERLAASDEELKNLRQELQLPPDAFIYLNVGRLDKPKNHKLLVDAFQKVFAEATNSYLIIAGSGSSERELKEQAKDLRLDEKILFLGTRNDIGALLEIADVFVFPSLLEGHPVALVEAMFKSLPCIASRIEVFEEVITDRETGLLIDPHSCVGLSKAMLELYNSRVLRKSLGDNACRHAETNFNSAAITKQWERFYQKISLSDA